MLRDNLVELIEPMRNSAGADPLALGIYQQKPASDDSLSCLENPRPEGAESSLTENVTFPFPAEPRQDQEPMFRPRVHEVMEGRTVVDIIGHNDTTRFQRGPCSIQFEIGISFGMRTIVDEEVNLSELRQ